MSLHALGVHRLCPNSNPKIRLRGQEIPNVFAGGRDGSAGHGRRPLRAGGGVSGTLARNLASLVV